MLPGQKAFCKPGSSVAEVRSELIHRFRISALGLKSVRVLFAKWSGPLTTGLLWGPEGWRDPACPVILSDTETCEFIVDLKGSAVLNLTRLLVQQGYAFWRFQWKSAQPQRSLHLGNVDIVKPLLWTHRKHGAEVRFGHFTVVFPPGSLITCPQPCISKEDVSLQNAH